MSKRVVQAALAVTLFVLVACGTAPVAPTATPAPVTPTGLAAPSPKGATPNGAAATSAAATPTPPPALSAGPMKHVPRNRTVILAWPIGSPIGVTNPWNSLGYTEQEGNSLLWEGLSYYAIFADKEIPWLAQSMSYTKADFTELTIKLNPRSAGATASR